MLLGMPTKQTWPGHTPSITMLRYALRRAPPLHLPDNFHARPPRPSCGIRPTRSPKQQGARDVAATTHSRGAFFFCKLLLVRQRFGNARPRRRCCTRTCLNPKAMLTGYALNYALKKKHIKGPLSAAAACASAAQALVSDEGTLRAFGREPRSRRGGSRTPALYQQPPCPCMPRSHASPLQVHLR